MIPSDILLIAALAVFVVAWWLKRLPARAGILLAAAAIAVIAGAWGVLDDRWQAGIGAAVGVLFLVARAALWLVDFVRLGARILFGAFIALLAACGAGALYMFPITDLPAPTGPYAVGVRTFVLTDEHRRGVLGDGPGEPRRLMVRVWYPAEAGSGARRMPYFGALEARTTAYGLGRLYGFPPLLGYLKHVRTNSLERAPLRAGAAGLPTVVYSHGYASFLGQGTALMEELASHGYAVYSVQHTYDSSPVVFPNGEVVEMAPALLARLGKRERSPAAKQALVGATFDARLEGQLSNRAEAVARGDRTVVVSAKIWLDDRAFVLDQLQRGNVPPEIADIARASNFGRTGQIGMSFGGSTTGAFCLADRRCAAGVNLDGADFHFSPFNADMPVPFLMFHSDVAGFYRKMGAALKGEPRSFNEFSYERFDNAGSRDDIYRLHVRGSAHLGMSDFSLFIRPPLGNRLVGSTPASIMIRSQNDFVRGFLDKHLRGIDNGFPGALYAAYKGWVEPIDNAPLRTWWLTQPLDERPRIEARINAMRPPYAGAAAAALP